MCQLTKFFVWCFLICLAESAASKSYLPAITINLNDDQPGKTITEFHNISGSDYTINILNINANVSFLIVQIHTFLENLTLSYQRTSDVQSYVTGTNIGLVWERDLLTAKRVNAEKAIFYLLRHEIGDLSLLISVSTYSKNEPVPGGCNLSFETMIAPYQHIKQTDGLITVTSQPPSIVGTFCDKRSVSTEMYYMYLKEYDNSSEEYFDGIQRMLTVENILKYGTKVPSNLGSNKYKQLYSRYSGIGRIFAVVATFKGRSSAYVPIASYGCNLYNWEEECLGPDGDHWRVVIAALFICGLLICFSGHRYFRISLFTSSYVLGVSLMLIIVVVDNDFSSQGKVIFSLIMGIFLAIFWVFLWWLHGIPVISVQPTFLLSAVIVASTVFYALGSFYIFSDDVLFWTTFGLIVLAVSQVPMFFLSPLYHIVALSLIGSYGTIVAMNYYVGGNLPYILINTYRRLTLKDFGMAVIDLPYSFLDISQTVLWIVLFSLGIYGQYKYSIGKPPFPPSRSGRQERRTIQRPSERTPLLYPQVPPEYTPYP